MLLDKSGLRKKGKRSTQQSGSGELKIASSETEIDNALGKFITAYQEGELVQS